MEEELISLERNEQGIKAIAQWQSKSVISITTSKNEAPDQPPSFQTPSAISVFPLQTVLFSRAYRVKGENGEMLKRMLTWGQVLTVTLHLNYFT